jgi:predicted ATP-grasp superfamily ATP-dependent carboligase
LSFGAVLSLHLNAAGCETVDLIALEPFYTPGLPDARAALALIRVLDRQFGTRTPVETLVETASSQREFYDRAVAGSEQLAALADHLEREAEAPQLVGDGANLDYQEVMQEVDQILSRLD